MQERAANLKVNNAMHTNQVLENRIALNDADCDFKVEP